MNTVKILKDSYHVMTKEMIELKRDKMTIAGMIVMPLIFLLLASFSQVVARMKMFKWGWSTWIKVPEVMNS
jgi:hypothetical protein